MDNLQAIKQQLLAKIAALQVNSTVEIAEICVKTRTNLNLLTWLKGQSCYPQFYLKEREGEVIWASIGQVRSFSALQTAQRFMAQHHLPLFGGVQFYGNTQFVLPRIMLRQSQEELSLSVFISQQNFAQDKLQALADLQQFAHFSPIAPLGGTLQLKQQKASQQQWCNWVEQGLTQIKQGKLRKIVLANESIFETSNSVNAIDFLAESERHNVGCYHFLFACGANSVFLGSTPERLYRRQETQLATEALAGTAFMTQNADLNEQQGQWLLQDPKNEYENQLVVQGICEQLEPLIERQQIGAVELKKLRKVQHLRRPIYAQLKEGIGDQDILSAIHPTAAIAGLPQQAAKSAVQKIENFDRTWYAGALGVMSEAQAEFCVTIRPAFIEPQNQGSQLRVFAGAGIVEGSVPQLEWQEIERKAASLVSLLQHHKEGEDVSQYI